MRMIQGAEKLIMHNHGGRTVLGMGTSKMGRRFSTSFKALLKKEIQENERSGKDDKPSQKPGKEACSINRGRYHNRPKENQKLVNVQRHVDPQVKWPQKMSTRSIPKQKQWCKFHNDHDHKMEDCISLKMKVIEILKKEYLLEFLSDKAKNLGENPTARTLWQL